MTKVSPTRSSRRVFSAGVAALAAAPFLLTQSARAAGKLYVRTPGGSFDEFKRAAVYEPFFKETGIEIVPVAATTAKLMAMLKSGQSELDLIDTGDSTLLEFEKTGGLMPIAYNQFKYSNVADIDPAVKREFQLGSFVYAMVLGFHTQDFPAGKHPRSWAEFWDVEKFPGRRTMPGMAAGTPCLEFALLADGVPMEKLYPIDIDRAFKSLSRIRSAVPKFWDTGALSTTMLTEHEVSMAAIWSTRLGVAIDKGAPLGVSWNQNAMLVQAYGIPKTSKNPQDALKFIDYASAPEVQARWFAKYKAIPVNQKAYPATAPELMDPETKQPWTRSKGFLLDIQWWADNRPKVAEYWSKWIIK